MAKKEKKPKEELDTQTTIADMNVEGFNWYDPNRKFGKEPPPKLTKKEQRALIRGAYRAMIPILGCMIVAMGIIFLLAWLWLKP